MNYPNLFSYAKSELSQDAFICWLLSWASPEHKDSDAPLHQCALKFIDAIFDKHEKVNPNVIKKIEVKKQDSNIDVLSIINDEYVILIEDKVGTKNNSNQLERYLLEIESRGYNKKCILPVYYKTKDQGSYESVTKEKFKVFLRSDILSVLNEYDGENSIIIDYRRHLQSISDAVDSYLIKPFEQWNSNSWIGFYIRLQ